WWCPEDRSRHLTPVHRPAAARTTTTRDPTAADREDRWTARHLVPADPGTTDPVTLRPLTRTLALAGTLGVGALAWAAVEARWFALRRVVVPVLEPGAPSLRVLHVSDLHLTPRRRETVAWVRDLARLEPDLVINTGDNLAHLDA